MRPPKIVMPPPAMLEVPELKVMTPAACRMQDALAGSYESRLRLIAPGPLSVFWPAEIVPALKFRVPPLLLLPYQTPLIVMLPPAVRLLAKIAPAPF